MSLIVQKFGGSSVADADRLRNVARIVTDTYHAGNQVVVVVSAQGDTTDDFIAKAAELNDRPSKREMDVLLSAGEQISMSLLAMAIQKMGCPTISLTGWQAGIQTDINYSEARIRKVKPERIRSELDRGRIVIIAGFQGINKQDDITTLGRGGSDTTAVAVAASLGADLCQIYTDVDGVYTADPRIVPEARKLNEITYDEMLELASLGAQVLHNRSVEMAKKYNVDLEVISSFTRNPGTKVKEGSDMEKLNVSGVARDNNCARIAVINLPDEPGVAFKVFSLLAKHKINVDIILQSVGKNKVKTISFTVPQDSAEETREVLNNAKEQLGYEAISVNTEVAKVSIVGAGMASNSGVAAKMFEALAMAGINIRMISTSEIKISVLINEEDSEKAVRAIHNKFFSEV
ncbi:MAG: aspartate kinase [Clostridiaceae bacterium]|nr:aspartate kinase [Clostridiaceae bacterium]